MRFGKKCEAKSLHPISDDLEIGMIKEVGNQFGVPYEEIITISAKILI